MKNNNEAWAAIFQELKILEALDAQPFFTISAKQINEIGRREARLMAKFDTQESLPDLFKSHALNINAVSNGNYIIFKDPGHRSFIKLPDYKQVVPVKFRPKLDFGLQTLTFSNNLSESAALDFAHHAGILSVYCGEEVLKLTTRGRFYSGGFNFELGAVGKVDVKGVQVEVDAGYEGREQFLILEAKSSTRSTFNIRQLYYPYRHFQIRTNKKIRTVLVSFSNGIYYFTEIAFSPDYYDYKITRNFAIEVEVGVERSLLTIEELLSQETYA